MKYAPFLFIEKRIAASLLKRLLELAKQNQAREKDGYYRLICPPSSSMEFTQIVELLDRSQTKYEIQTMGRAYDKKDYEDKALYELVISENEISVFDASGTILRRMPPFSECVVCYSKIKGNVPLSVKKPRGKAEFFHVMSLNRYIVSDRVKKAFTSNHITGIRFLPVYQQGKGRPLEEYWEMSVVSMMPPLREEDNIVLFNERIGYDDKCTNCGRRKLCNDIPYRLFYRDDDINGINDVNITHDRFSLGLRRIIISKKVHEVCTTYKFKGGTSFPTVAVITAAGEEVRPNQSDNIETNVHYTIESHKVVTLASVKKKLLRHISLDLVNKIVLEAQPSYRLFEDNRVNNPPFSSKIGGFPDLPSDLSWPEWDGRKLDFIAQINCSKLPKGAADLGLPSKGMLWFFYDLMSQPWGFDPKDRGAWRVVYQDMSSNDTGNFVGTSVENIGTTKYMRLIREITFSTNTDEIFGKVNATEQDIENYKEILEALYDEDTKLSRLGGYPDEIQGDIRFNANAASNGYYSGGTTINEKYYKIENQEKEWVLLLQVDSDDSLGLEFGDMGRLYFCIERNRLIAQDFSNVWVVLQCG